MLSESVMECVPPDRRTSCNFNSLVHMVTSMRGTSLCFSKAPSCDASEFHLHRLLLMHILSQFYHLESNYMVILPHSHLM